MKKLITLLIFTFTIVVLTLALKADSEQSKQEIERGKYIVHNVAMCIMCHTPKDREGNLEEHRLLEGSPIPVKSPYPNEEWATRAPTLKGLGGFQEDDVISLLTTGSRINETEPKRPMPPFRMNEKDARAVVSYLKSVK